MIEKIPAASFQCFSQFGSTAVVPEARSPLCVGVPHSQK